MPHPRSSSKIAALRKRFKQSKTALPENSGERRVQKNLRLPESAARRLAELAKADGVSQADLVIRALAAYEARTTPRS